MKASRVAMPHQFLAILQPCQATDFVNFLIWDESWSVLEYSYSSVWAASRDDVPETDMTEIDIVMGMISIIWSISGIHGLLTLTKGMKYNSQYFCQHVILDTHINQYICSSSRRKTLKEILLDLDNAPAHNSRVSSGKIESTQAHRVSHPRDSPD
jgi:hypothetical protein